MEVVEYIVLFIFSQICSSISKIRHIFGRKSGGFEGLYVKEETGIGLSICTLTSSAFCPRMGEIVGDDILALPALLRRLISEKMVV